MIFLVNGLRLSILTSLTPYVTSSFESHSLLTVIYIVSSALVSATYIPMAKLLDVWGRAEGFLLMVGCSTLGTILMATSKNLATFCAAEVSHAPTLIQTPNHSHETRSSTPSVLQASFTQ